LVELQANKLTARFVYLLQIISVEIGPHLEEAIPNDTGVVLVGYASQELHYHKS